VNYIDDDAGNPLEQIDTAGGVLCYQDDQYGSTRLLTNATGAVAATFSYDPYGNLTGCTGTADTPLRWNGKYQDSGTGLYYLRARYSDATTAQFLTRDPLEALTQHAYSYAYGDPLGLSDPTGLDPFLGGIGAIAGGVIGGGTSGVMYAVVHQGDFSGRSFAAETVGGLTGGLANKFVNGQAVEAATVQLMRPLVGRGAANAEGRNAARLVTWTDTWSGSSLIMAGRLTAACGSGFHE
jgi:RHS repeat-associated protein